jgi:hypothetical protein
MISDAHYQELLEKKGLTAPYLFLIHFIEEKQNLDKPLT